MENPLIRKRIEKTHCSINEAAYLIGCHRNTILKRFEDGILTKIKPYGAREVHLNLAEINRYLAGEVAIIKKDTKISIDESISKTRTPKKKRVAKRRLDLEVTNSDKNQSKINVIKKPRRRKKRIKKKEEKPFSIEEQRKSTNDKTRNLIDKSFKKNTDEIDAEHLLNAKKLKKSKFHYKPNAKKFYKRESKSDIAVGVFTKEKKNEIDRRRKLKVKKSNSKTVQGCPLKKRRAKMFGNTKIHKRVTEVTSQNRIQRSKQQKNSGRK